MEPMTVRMVVMNADELAALVREAVKAELAAQTVHVRLTSDPERFEQLARGYPVAVSEPANRQGPEVQSDPTVSPEPQVGPREVGPQALPDQGDE